MLVVLQDYVLSNNDDKTHRTLNVKAYLQNN